VLGLDLKHEEEGVMAGKKGKKGKAISKKPPHQPKDFDDFDPTSTLNPSVHDIRGAITSLRKSLFATLNVDPTKFNSIIRIEPKGGPLSKLSASCGCGCS